MTEIIRSFADISDRYDAVLCDVWGCFHNGVSPLPGAVAALQAYRRRGGTVALLTNAPRPETAVLLQLQRMKAPEDAWDLIVSSGGAARDAVRRGEWGKKVFHIGTPGRDDAFFDGAEVERVSLEEAESIVCTGLVDDVTEVPSDYEDLLTEAHLRRLRFLCANPDLVVDVGDQRRYCAGSLAAMYREKGGEVMEYGKPHPQIYDYARMRLAETMGREIDPSRLLCIGDGVLTDVRGAIGQDLDSLFITAGLAAEEVNGSDGAPDPAKLVAFSERHMLSPRWAMGLLE
ncbi:MAG: TIGR01459 family HAD-type hydrolase [Pseudomonadota bacterium]